MRIAYVAAPWQEKDAGRRIRAILRRRGVYCSATWLDRPDEEYSCNAPEALQDESDLRRADLLVAYVPEDDTSRGGRDTEIGIALGLMHQIVLIGRPRQLFHAHPRVEQYNTIEDWEADWKAPLEHCCGARGFGLGYDDKCPACEEEKKNRA